MNTRVKVLQHLKQHGPCSIQDLIAALGISENAVRHHLGHLKQEGFIQESIEKGAVGRPSKRFEVTLAAEGEFPKRYKELLEIVLEQAATQDMLEPLIKAVAQRLSRQIKPDLQGLHPKARLNLLMEKLDYGDMLGHLQDTPGGWEFKAYNCVYRDTGCKFEPVCNLLPSIIRLSTDLQAERVICQRDGMPYCHFAGDYE
jgi:predicted ArsR family transcriptional regulator